ncbi:hypothetical protein [Pseudomonas sp. DSP3-2-2]|uniref:hypothetical protein n=1 Tax=unclassified Pseudomonas TaxID=196821 RepID=UPI003CEDB095
MKIPNITYKFSDQGTVVFTTQNPRTKKGRIEVTITIPDNVEWAELEPICDGMVARCQGLALLTGQSYIICLKYIFFFISEENKSIPGDGSTEWKRFIVDNFIHHFSDSHHQDVEEESIVKTKSKYETRRANWRLIAGLYKKLKQLKIIPSNVIIPRATPKRPKLGNATVPLGYQQTLSALIEPDEPWPKSYLIDRTIGLSNEEFFDAIRTKLIQATNSTIEGCVEYWEKMKAVHQLGKCLIAAITEEQIEAVIASGVYYKNGKHLADPDSAQGFSWFLATINYYFRNTDQLKAVNYTDMMNIPFLRPIVNNHNIQIRINQEIKKLTAESSNIQLNTNEALNRLLGFFSARDCAAACMVLIKENPRFTSMSLQQADLLMPNGVPYIFSNADNSKTFFGISKPRASARKISLLPALSESIFNDVLACTECLRSKLLKAGNINYRKLFLTSTDQGIGNPTSIARNVSGAGVGRSLFEELGRFVKEGQILRSSFTLPAMRATQGILEFLHTGSLHAVSDKLGNTIDVVRSSYVPRWLLERWVVRLIRVFQQKLIIVSAHSDPWLFAATDFLTEGQLLKFIIKTVTESTGQDAFSRMIRDKLGPKVLGHTEVFEPLAVRNMTLKLTPTSLALIYAYADGVNSMDQNLRYVKDIESGLSADSINLLACIMKTAASDNCEEHINWSIRNNLQGDSVAELRDCHKLALAQVGTFKTTIKAFRLSTRTCGGN